MENKKQKTLVLAGLFAALCCVGTFIHVPTLVTNGYVNLGDPFVLTSGFVLGPVWGFLAGGIGSMLTDIFLGYPIYAPGTFIIKGLMALVAAVLFKLIYKKTEKPLLSKISAAIPAEILMVLGYFLYEAFILGYGLAAAGSIFGNSCQGICGIVVAAILSKFIKYENK